MILACHFSCQVQYLVTRDDCFIFFQPAHETLCFFVTCKSFVQERHEKKVCTRIEMHETEERLCKGFLLTHPTWLGCSAVARMMGKWLIFRWRLDRHVMGPKKL